MSNTQVNEYASHANGSAMFDTTKDKLLQLNLDLKNLKLEENRYAKFHGDELIGVSSKYAC